MVVGQLVVLKRTTMMIIGKQWQKDSLAVVYFKILAFEVEKMRIFFSKLMQTYNKNGIQEDFCLHLYLVVPLKKNILELGIGVFMARLGPKLIGFNSGFKILTRCIFGLDSGYIFSWSDPTQNYIIIEKLYFLIKLVMINYETCIL